MPREASFRRITENPLDQAAVVARKNKVVRTLVAGVGQTLKSSKVTVKNGTGIILGRENRQIECNAARRFSQAGT